MDKDRKEHFCWEEGDIQVIQPEGESPFSESDFEDEDDKEEKGGKQ